MTSRGMWRQRTFTRSAAPGQVTTSFSFWILQERLGRLVHRVPSLGSAKHAYGTCRPVTPGALGPFTSPEALRAVLEGGLPAGLRLSILPPLSRGGARSSAETRLRRCVKMSKTAPNMHETHVRLMVGAELKAKDPVPCGSRMSPF